MVGPEDVILKKRYGLVAQAQGDLCITEIKKKCTKATNMRPSIQKTTILVLLATYIMAAVDASVASSSSSSDSSDADSLDGQTPAATMDEEGQPLKKTKTHGCDGLVGANGTGWNRAESM